MKTELKLNDQTEYRFDIIDQVPVIRINHPKASSVIALQGGQVLSFKPTGGAEQLWLSKKAIFDGKTAIRGGVPVCWPWFGNAGKPSHGFARLETWKLESISSNAEKAEVCLSLKESDCTPGLFPYQFTLYLNVTITDTLKIELHIENRDSQALSFTSALHSYFSVNDIESSEISGLDSQCLNSVNNGQNISVNQPLRFEHSLDYVFDNNRTVTLGTDKRLCRISSIGADSLVIWTPWQEGASAMEDMEENEFRQMLCIEPAIYSESLELKSGERFTLDLLVEPVISN